MGKKELRMKVSYETNRLASVYLSEAYDKLIPIIKHPIVINKNEAKTEEIIMVKKIKRKLI
jgi:hypothetical protein